MGLLFGITKERAVIERKTKDNAVLEVRQENGDTMLLHLPGLGINPFITKIGASILLTMVNKKIQNVEPLQDQRR